MAAVFYIPVVDGQAPPSLDELATRVGLSDILREPGQEVLYARWGVMESIRVERQILRFHVCLQLFPHLSDLLDRRGAGTDDAIAEAFRGACEALRPQAALLYTRPDAVEPEYIAAQYPKVLGLDGILLDESYPVLLYLDSEIAAHFPAHYRTGRDSLPVSDGLLLFRGTGAHRWW